MAASDTDEFESADEDYEYKEQKTPIKKIMENDQNKKSNKQLDINKLAAEKENIDINEKLTNNELKQSVESEISNASNDMEIVTNTVEEINIQDSNVNEDGWDDFGEEEWIDTIPENNKIDSNNAKVESNNTPILSKPESNTDNSDGKVSLPDSKKYDSSKTEEKHMKNPPIFNKPQSFTENASDKVHQIPTTEDNNQENEASSSWGGWKPWGGIVSSVFTAASEGVTTLTTLIETGIGAPNPEVLVKINKENIECDSNDQSIKPNKTQDTIPSLGNLVSGVTSIGNKVITGGLDTLEGIGKKTMNILQENDPLLLQKRKFMGLENERPNLSQVLREAKEKSEEVEKNLKQMQKQAYKKQLHFESLFDNYYGLVHLEALEMLSKQAALKLKSLLDPLSGKALTELKETLNEVNELCDLGDLDINDTEEPYTRQELQEKLESAIEDLGVEITFEEILKCWQKNIDQLDNANLEPNQIYENGLRCLAETCALQINKMHKIAELLMIKEHHSTANETDSLVQMTTIFCYHLHGIANKFCRKLNTFEQNEELSSLITNLFLEVYNSTTYVQSAFKLFIPILQVGAA